jgi:hypothetical protein
LGVLETDLLGDGDSLVRVAADEHEADPGGGEAEGDGPAADAVGGAGDAGLKPVAAVQGLSGAEESGVDHRREAHGGAGGSGRHVQRPRRLRTEDLSMWTRTGYRVANIGFLRAEDIAM